MENNFEDTMVLNYLEDNTKKNFFKNEELKSLIQFKLDKTYFEEKDLIQIEDITLDGRKINGDINIVDFNEIDYFPNLKKIEIKNLDISEEHMKKLENLEEIYFKDCKVETISSLKNVKKLSINNSIITNFSEIEKFQELIELEVINIEIKDFDFINNLGNLKVLKIKNIKDFSLDKINNKLPIDYLSLEGIKEISVEYLLKVCPNLKTLSIQREKQKEWSEKLKNLMQKGVKILLNDIYEY